jgi:hypothetical protein
MGNRLTHRLGWRGHWLHMLGGDNGKVNAMAKGDELESGRVYG